MDAPEKPSRRRAGRIALVAVVLIAAYGVAVGLLLPPLAKKVIADRLGEKLGRTVVIDEVTLNPYTLNATVKGFRILEPDRQTVFASFDQLDVAGSISSFYRLAPVADGMSLSGLYVHLVRDGDTHYNVSDILTRLDAVAPSKEPARQSEFSVSNIRVNGGRVDFDDRPRGRKHAVTEIDLAIPFVSNLPAHLKEFVQPKFSAKVNGTPVGLTGETLPFQNSLRTNVAITLDALEVPTYVAYSPTALPVKVDAGKLHAKLAVTFTQVAGKPPSVDVSGVIGLTGVALSIPDQNAAFKIGTVDLDIASFDPLDGLAHVSSVRVADASARQGEWLVPTMEAKEIRVDVGKKSVRVGSVATQGGTFKITRARDGSVELPMARAKGYADAAAQQPSPWTLALGSFALDGYKLTLADASVKPATTHRVEVAHLEARDLSTEKGAKSTLAARIVTDGAGSIDLDSTFALDPLALDARIDARRIDLVPLRPYAAHFARVGLKSARASAKGTLTVGGSGEALRIGYAGAADLSNFATIDTLLREDLINWDAVKLTGVVFHASKNDLLDLTVGEVAVNKAYARVVVTPEGKINLQQLRFAGADDPAATSAPPVEPRVRKVRIDRVTFANSRLNFSDNFIKPNYSADVGGLAGSVTNLSSDPAARGVVDLKGKYDATSPVLITGTVNPLSGELFLDIAAKGSDIELPKLTAYSQRYAGYGITAGKLTLDVKYHVEGGKLTARNKIRLDQLTFGDKVESAEATQLPVIFAVNLLKDSKGVIDVELPITGSLADPQFDIGDLIAQVVGSLFRKAITSPFSLLTAAFGESGSGTGKGAPSGSGEDLAFVQFDPGRDEIGAAGRKKLDTLGKALLDRPAIRIEMAGRTDAEKDLAALKRAALLAKVKAAKRAGLAADGKAAAEGVEVTVDDNEYPRYLKAAFEQEKIPRPAAKVPAAETKDGKPAPPKELTVAEMEALLLERLAVGDEALQALAQRRAERVKGYLVTQAQLPAERVLVAAARTGAAEKASQSRVELTLK